MLDMLMITGAVIAAVAVVLAPLVWAGYRIYANWSVWSLTRRVGTIVLSVFGTFVVGVGIMMVMFVIEVGSTMAGRVTTLKLEKRVSDSAFQVGQETSPVYEYCLIKETT